MLKNFKIFIVLAVFAIIILFSYIRIASLCKAKSIAKDVENRWHYSYTTTYNDGSEIQTDVYLWIFRESHNEYGHFKESTVSAITYCDNEGSNYSFPYCTYIEGDWKISHGNLQRKYDMSSLKVKVKQDEIVDLGYEYLTTKINDDAHTNMLIFYGGENENNKVLSDVFATESMLFFESRELGMVLCERYYGDLPWMDF